MYELCKLFMESTYIEQRALITTRCNQFSNRQQRKHEKIKTAGKEPHVKLLDAWLLNNISILINIYLYLYNIYTTRNSYLNKRHM